ncbi:hypothetical protein HPB47_006387 [Ixodes persulcatus]|uniref:Uncharacterized protein n=1 Tax=Ixodes persulcatus TaxID=34615 RepID=A0AC60PAH9_IXOPE|nr:hypothetical protein HPB47_006387 [Ixodes persulcatus]
MAVIWMIVVEQQYKARSVTLPLDLHLYEVKQMDPRVEDIRRAIRSFKDFPKKGILFRDVLPIFHNPDVFRKLIDVLAEQVRSSVPDVSAVVGIEARGFIIAPALALALNVAFVPVRKPGKLPGTVKSQAYTLEYGEDKLEVQEDGFLKGRKVVIVDDLLATGGETALALYSALTAADCPTSGLIRVNGVLGHQTESIGEVLVLSAPAVPMRGLATAPLASAWSSERFQTGAVTST